MLYKMDEILLIENLTYFENIPPFIGILESKGMTIEEWMNSIDLDAIELEKDYATYMTGFDFKNLILAIKRHPKLMEARVIETHYDAAYGGGGGVSALFINEEMKEAVVAFRGTAANEWNDDFVASNQIDSLQQINALEWYRKIYDDYELSRFKVTVTGHSKGGNKSKYITILDDTVNRCISFDGQGFSDVFMEHYRERILLRQDKIKNHNVDFDYVNILLNDIGEKTYYYGYDYGKGGFAEAHCPNTFFDFKENGDYAIRINPAGQRPEMQILDQFINSMSRSDFNEKEKNETAKLLGTLIEKAFAIGSSEENTATDYISFLCDLIRDETYSNNTAYLLAFVIKYSQENPNFLQALKDIMVHFNMNDFVDIIDVVTDIVTSKKLDRIVNLSNFLVLHVNGIVTKTIQSIAKKKFNLDLTKEQVQGLCTIVSMTKEMLTKIHMDMDGTDIVLEEETTSEHYTMPEVLNIVVLAGGLSTQRNISIKAGYDITNTLKEAGHNVILLDAYMGYGEKEEIIEHAFMETEKYSMIQSEVDTDIADLWAVKKRRQDQSSSYFGPNILQICKQSDIVFIALEGDHAENGKVQACFDLLGIDYTGCDYFSSALSTNKSVAKQLLRNKNIPVPNGYSLRKGERTPDPKTHGLLYPLVVKPCNGDIGLGISIATDKVSLNKAIKEAFRWEQEIIVEEYIRGREFSVSTINGKALPVIEILPLKTTDADTDLTLAGQKVKNCPAEISEYLTYKLESTAELVSDILGCKEYSLVDFIVIDDKNFKVIECDSLPDFSKDGLFYTEAKASGMTYSELLEVIIELTLLSK